MVKLRAAGNIFKEVSQNIPSSEFALKELIKNSYEANANIFEFDLNNTSKRIVISDDGTGMNNEDIESLLTLSKSDKKFGTKVNNRYVSGQKGIGFFSVFKFGNKISVRTSDTSKPLVHNFNLDLNEIIKKIDISSIDVPIHDKIDSKFKGTEIVIEDLNTEIIDIFNDLMKDPGDSSRLTNCIHDPSFKIKIMIDNSYVVSDVNPSADFQSAKMAEVKFFSLKKPYKFEITYNGKTKQYDIPDNFQKFLKTTGLELQIQIDIYNFENTKTKIKTKDAPKIFYYSKLKRISPLIYINNSIFSDNDIYNIEINASSSSSYVFRQQTGYIFIFLNNDNILQFNTDRTKINESKTYEALKSFTAFLSMDSQKELRKLINEEKEEKNPKINKHYLNNSSNNIDLELEITKNQSDNLKQRNRILKDSVQIGVEYKFDDIVALYDSEGTQKYKPLKISFCPSDGVSFNKKNKTITFLNSAEYSLRIEYEDKTTNNKENKEFSGKINAINKHKKEKGTPYFIECYVKESDQIDSVISTFRFQLNHLYLSQKYVTVFVSSLRTFVEIVVRNIAKILDLKYDPDEIPLKQLLNTVLSEQVVNDTFLNQMKNGGTKSGLKNIYNKIILQEKESKDSSIIDVLNIFTHSGPKLLNLDDANKEKTCINFLFSFLNYLLRHPKSDNKISHQ